jgi:hypothetical protein
MPLNSSGRNAMLTSGKAGFTHVGALTALTPTEVAGGAYARQAVTWQAAGTPAAGQSGNNGAIAIPIPAGSTPIVLGLYDAVSAGNLLGTLPYGSAGQPVSGMATIDASTDLFLSKAHGLTTDDRVFFSTVNGEAIPTGISVTTLYFVLAAGLTADAFQVSTTSGGGALNVTVSGECGFFKTVPNAFASAGNINIATNAMILDLNYG